MFDDVTSFSVRLFLLFVQVKVQHKKFGLLSAISAAGGAHQASVGRSDSPHDTTWIKDVIGLATDMW